MYKADDVVPENWYDSLLGLPLHVKLGPTADYGKRTTAVNSAKKSVEASKKTEEYFFHDLVDCMSVEKSLLIWTRETPPNFQFFHVVTKGSKSDRSE